MEEVVVTDDPLPAGDVLLAASWGPKSYELVTAAAGLASSHERPLRVVHVVRDVDWLLDPRPADQLLDAALRRGHLLLADMAAIVHDLAPAAEVRRRLLLGSLYDAVLGEATSAAAVVVGPGLLAQWLRGHAACPVTTVSEPVDRRRARPRRPSLS